MSGWLSIGVSIAAVFVAAASIHAHTPGDLKAGDPAPAFKLEGSDGKTYRLADFAGKKAVVLAWFPKAFTGG
jgi:thioredoxin-dependent peroxiredoxin